MKIQLFFLFTFLLVLVSLASVQAVPPVSTVQQFSTGYVVEYPPNQILKSNQNQTFNFHVFNISNGLLIIADTQCFFHLYNSSGGHIVILNTSTISDDLDYEFQVLGGNFSVGTYSYITQCNNSDAGLGGFISVPFQVTPDGYDYSSDRSLGYILLTIFFLILSITLFVFGIKSKSISLITFMVLASLASIFFAFQTFLLNPTIISTGLYDLLIVWFDIYSTICIFAMAVAPFIFLADLLSHFKNKKKKKINESEGY